MRDLSRLLRFEIDRIGSARHLDVHLCLHSMKKKMGYVTLKQSEAGTHKSSKPSVKHTFQKNFMVDSIEALIFYFSSYPEHSLLLSMSKFVNVSKAAGR